MVTKRMSLTFLVLVMLLAMLTACATKPTQTGEKPFEVRAWQALKISISAYDGSMQALKELYATGIIPADTAQKAWDAGEGYYLAQKGAIAALRVYVGVKTASSQQDLNVAIASAAVKLGQFTVLVTPFIVKTLSDDLKTAEAKLKEVK